MQFLKKMKNNLLIFIYITILSIPPIMAPILTKINKAKAEKIYEESAASCQTMIETEGGFCDAVYPLWGKITYTPLYFLQDLLILALLGLLFKKTRWASFCMLTLALSFIIPVFVDSFISIGVFGFLLFFLTYAAPILRLRAQYKKSSPSDMSFKKNLIIFIITFGAGLFYLFLQSNETLAAPPRGDLLYFLINLFN